MCRHIYDWNIVNCDVKQLIHSLTKKWCPKVPKQAKAKRDGVINPQNNNLNDFCNVQQSRPTCRQLIEKMFGHFFNFYIFIAVKDINLFSVCVLVALRHIQRYFSNTCICGGTYIFKRTEEVRPMVGLPRHRHFVRFFNMPVQAPTRDQPFYGYSETPPYCSRLLRLALGLWTSGDFYYFVISTFLLEDWNRFCSFISQFIRFTQSFISHIRSIKHYFKYHSILNFNINKCLSIFKCIYLGIYLTVTFLGGCTNLTFF